MQRGAWLVAVPLAFVGLAFVAPMAHTLADAVAPGSLDYATGPFVRHVLVIALQQAALSTLLTLAIALPLAWLHHSRGIPWSRFQMAVHAAPFVMPVFVIVYGLQAVLGPHGWIHGAFGWDLLGWLGPFGAVVLAHAYYNYGFAARLIETALRRRPIRLEAAARTLGASPGLAFLRTTVPVLWPAIAAVALLVFLFTFGSFGVVLLMGAGPAGRVWTLETAMFENVNHLFGDATRAAVLGVLQLGVNALLLLGYLALRRRMARTPAEPERPAGHPRPLATTIAWAAAAISALPILAVLVQGFRLGGTWSLAPWQALLHALPACAAGEVPLACGDPLPDAFDLGAALGLSALYAATSTAVALALTACLAYGSRRLGGPLRRAAEGLASLPVAGSGILLGVAYFATFGVAGPWPLEGTVWIVLLAHTVLVFPFVARLVLPAWEAHDPALDEAAQLLGAPPRQVMARVHWPALKPAILAAASLAAALSLADFGASSMLQEEGTRGLTVWIAQVDGPFNPILHASAVALAGLLCVLTLGAYFVVERAAMRSGKPTLGREVTPR